MNTALWIIQGLLAIAFLMAGVMKLTQSKGKLYERMEWVEDFSGGNIRLIGVLEILGALGLLLPGLVGVLTWLTPLAGLGLSIIMIGAMVTHFRRQEYPNMASNLILMLLALFVFFGRFFIEPLA